MDYEWNQDKARSNLRQHGVDFADAAMALEDGLALTIPDPDSEGEERFVSLGMDSLGSVLATVFSVLGDRTRIISSRKATRNERAKYEKLK